jgi:hypothetical protein
MTRDLTVSPKNLDSLNGLELFEEQVILASQDMGDARDRFAYHLHLILEHRLWRHRKTESGDMAFTDQQEYLEYLSSRCLAAISTMKAYHGAIRLAKHLGYDTMETIGQIGLSIFMDMRDRLEIKRDTGEPLGLRYGKLPEGKELKSYLHEVIEQVSPDEKTVALRPYDRRRTLDQIMCVGVPRIEFDIPDMTNNPGYITWHVEMYEEDGMLVDIPGNHGQVNKNTPTYVLRDLAKRLGVGWKLEN